MPRAATTNSLWILMPNSTQIFFFSIFWHWCKNATKTLGMPKCVDYYPCDFLKILYTTFGHAKKKNVSSPQHPSSQISIPFCLSLETHREGGGGRKHEMRGANKHPCWTAASSQFPSIPGALRSTPPLTRLDWAGGSQPVGRVGVETQKWGGGVGLAVGLDPMAELRSRAGHWTVLWRIFKVEPPPPTQRLRTSGVSYYYLHTYKDTRGHIWPTDVNASAHAARGPERNYPPPLQHLPISISTVSLSLSVCAWVCVSMSMSVSLSVSVCLCVSLSSSSFSSSPGMVLNNRQKKTLT